MASLVRAASWMRIARIRYYQLYAMGALHERETLDESLRGRRSTAVMVYASLGDDVASKPAHPILAGRLY